MSWGDGLWENIAILHETAGMPIEPGPLKLHCKHCGDPYHVEDEDRDYPGHCIGCAEWFRDLDRQDAVVFAAEEPPSHRR